MRAPHYIKEGFTDEEIEKIVKTFDNTKSYPPTIIGEFLRKRDKAAFLFACYIGGRPSEILCLEWKDIDYNENLVRICPYTNKQRETLSATLTEKAKNVLLTYKEIFDKFIHSPFIFPSITTFEPMTANYFEKRLIKIEKEAGVYSIGYVTQTGQTIARKTFYGARKYYGTKVYLYKRDPYEAMRALRQRKLDSVTPYILLSRDALKEDLNDIFK